MSLTEMERELAAVGAAVGAGCQPCTHYHAQAALKTGLPLDTVIAAIEDARDVRARGGTAVANVGRRVLGIDQHDAPAAEPPASRGAALARLGAAAGCNSGALLSEFVGDAPNLGINAAAVQEVVGIAEMVKTQAAKFLQRDIERVLAQVPASSADAGNALAAACCGPAPVAVSAGDCSPGCGED